MLGCFLGALRRHLRRIGSARNTPRAKLFALNVIFLFFGFDPVDLPLFFHGGHLSRRTPLNFLAAFFFAADFLTALNSPDVLLRLVHAVTRRASSSVACASWRFFAHRASPYPKAQTGCQFRRNASTRPKSRGGARWPYRPAPFRPSTAANCVIVRRRRAEVIPLRC
jgi:hypothetical protein